LTGPGFFLFFQGGEKTEQYANLANLGKINLNSVKSGKINFKSQVQACPFVTAFFIVT
jgi:hypothetical protein